MSRPALPQPAPGEVLLVCTAYGEGNGRAQWGAVLDATGGRREGDGLVLGDGGVRLRPVEDPGWDFLHGGNVPELLPRGARVPPVVVLVDIPAVYGGEPLLVDLAEVPGRGARVAPARLGEILAALTGGRLAFEDLVREMDVYGVYQGDGGRPAHPAPAVPLPPRSFPPLPSIAGALLVRTCFDDEDGWRALLDELGGADAEGWVGSDTDWDEIDPDDYPLQALVVDDPAFAGLLPGQVPALIAAQEDTTAVALADGMTFAEPGRPLTVVDLYDLPGRTAVLPRRQVGSMVCNLEIGNMDFHDFIAGEGETPWWDGS